MAIVFYDFDTSDANFLGQILRFRFIEADNDLSRTRAETEGVVEINRLQLPAPEAVLSNRIDVLKHQKNATCTEMEAAKQIYQYLTRVLKKNDEKVYLTGFGSSSFDIHFLRTLFIRYGFNPYFPGFNNLEYRDLRHIVHKLYIQMKLVDKTKENSLYSLKDACRAVGIKFQDGVSSLVDLAYTLQEQFGVSISKFSPYDGWNKEIPGSVFMNYVPFGEDRMVTYLDGSQTKAWWVDLDKFRDGDVAGSLIYVNKRATPFFLSKIYSDRTYVKLAGRVLKEMSGINPQEVAFTDMECDVEQHIYKIPFAGFSAIRAAIWDDDREAILKFNNPDVTAVVKRVLLANYKWRKKDPRTSKNANDQYMLNLLKRYGKYRYQGKCNLSKKDPESSMYGFHATIGEMIEKSNPDLYESKEDKKLLNSLRKFYSESDLLQYALTNVKI